MKKKHETHWEFKKIPRFDVLKLHGWMDGWMDGALLKLTLILESWIVWARWKTGFNNADALLTQEMYTLRQSNMTMETYHL